MNRSSSLPCDPAPLLRNPPQAEVRRITRLALAAVLVFDLAGAGAILALGEVHASHPEISLIELH